MGVARASRWSAPSARAQAPPPPAWLRRADCHQPLAGRAARAPRLLSEYGVSLVKRTMLPHSVTPTNPSTPLAWGLGRPDQEREWWSEGRQSGDVTDPARRVPMRGQAPDQLSGSASPPPRPSPTPHRVGAWPEVDALDDRVTSRLEQPVSGGSRPTLDLDARAPLAVQRSGAEAAEPAPAALAAHDHSSPVPRHRPTQPDSSTPPRVKDHVVARGRRRSPPARGR